MSQRYTDEQLFSIFKMNSEGFSSRQIARKLGISKSGVNYALDRTETTSVEKHEGARILFMDFETSAALVYCFGRHKQFINQDAVEIEGGRLLMGGYAINDEPVQVIYDRQEIELNMDYYVCKTFYELFKEVDVVVAHNLKGFDLKMLNARLVANGIPPLHKVQMIDTLEIAKKHFRLPSNKLDSIAAYYGIGRKVEHSGISLWIGVQNGNITDIKKMAEYCEGDVELLREVFYKLSATGLCSGFNQGHYYDDDKKHCRVCGSENVYRTGLYVYTPMNKFPEYACGDCGTIQRSRTSETTKQKRANLLS